MTKSLVRSSVNFGDSSLGHCVEASGADSGTIWLTDSGYQLIRYNFTVSGSYPFTKYSRRIQGLNDPSGVAIGGPSNHLYVAVTGDGRFVNTTSLPRRGGWHEMFGNEAHRRRCR